MTSGLTVPSLTVEGGASAASLTSASLDATDATLGGLDVESIDAATVTAGAVATTDLTVANAVGALAVSDLTVNTATVSSLSTTRLQQRRDGDRLRGVLAVPVGTAVFGGGACAASGSWSEADCSCAAAFSDPSPAHVCTAEELLVFAESQPQALPADLDGASFQTFVANVGRTVTMPLPDGQVRLTYVDNCGFWSSFEPDEGPSFSARDDTMAAARHVIRVVADAGGGLKALQSDISTDCRRSAVRLACCL
ncbi:MAG: hypothetical protein Q8O67_11120 [Deltaproteobacteria bacterium]|nr:hypothetical protein [Deltaproteobacteria bacterium]